MTEHPPHSNLDHGNPENSGGDLYYDETDKEREERLNIEKKERHRKEAQEKKKEEEEIKRIRRELEESNKNIGELDNDPTVLSAKDEIVASLTNQNEKDHEAGFDRDHIVVEHGLSREDQEKADKVRAYYEKRMSEGKNKWYKKILKRTGVIAKGISLIFAGFFTIAKHWFGDFFKVDFVSDSKYEPKGGGHGGGGHGGHSDGHSGGSHH